MASDVLGFNLCTRKAKRRYIKEIQIYLLMTKASNIKSSGRNLTQSEYIMIKEALRNYLPIF